MLDKLADSINAQLALAKPPPMSVVQMQIRMYERALEQKDPPFPTVSREDELQWRKSLETLLNMYKSGLLDGTKTTWICAGKVIEEPPEDSMSQHTIVDQPPAEQYHLRMACGPRHDSGFHFVRILAKLFRFKPSIEK